MKAAPGTLERSSCPFTSQALLMMWASGCSIRDIACLAKERTGQLPHFMTVHNWLKKVRQGDITKERVLRNSRFRFMLELEEEGRMERDRSMAFGMVFLFTDQELIYDLQELERSGTIISIRHVSSPYVTDEGFYRIRTRLTPAQIVRYFEGSRAFEQWLAECATGVSPEDALKHVLPYIARDVADYVSDEQTVGYCQAAFIGAELEELLCGEFNPTNSEILDRDKED